MPKPLGTITTALGLTHTFTPDGEGGLVVGTTQPAMGVVLERNKAAATHNDGYTADRTMRRVASIPLWLIHKWRVDEGIDFNDPNDWPAIRRKLNDPEYLWLRSAPGRV